MFAVSHLYDVHLVDRPQRLHVHPADTDALSAIEPGELLVGRCKVRSDHERGQRVEFAAERASVTVGTEIEHPAIGAEEPHPGSGLYHFHDADDRDSILADAHPVPAAGQHGPFETWSLEMPLGDVPIDPQSVRQVA